MKSHSSSQGFTLLEILLVVAAISILAGIVIVAINPARQLGETRNAQRRVDSATIVSAIQQYSLKEGHLPVTILEADYCGQSQGQEICQTDASSCSGLIDLSVLTDDAKYVVSIPIDPQGGVVAGGNGTGYYAIKKANGRVSVCAAQAELGESITATQ